jgi:hypothetical protein
MKAEITRLVVSWASSEGRYVCSDWFELASFVNSGWRVSRCFFYSLRYYSNLFPEPVGPELSVIHTLLYQQLKKLETNGKPVSPPIAFPKGVSRTELRIITFSQDLISILLSQRRNSVSGGLLYQSLSAISVLRFMAYKRKAYYYRISQRRAY